MSRELLQVQLNELLKDGQKLKMWWRDDDMVADTERFRQLMDSATHFDSSVLVSMIPADVSESMSIAEVISPRTRFCQHGWAHRNHEPPHLRPSEFGANRDTDVVWSEIANGKRNLDRICGVTMLPIFVPPWNAFDTKHLGALEACGFRGLSLYGPREKVHAGSRIRVENIHVDILNWTGDKQVRAVDSDVVYLRLCEHLQRQRKRPLSDQEPFGILTHHRAMDEDSWRVIHSVCEHLASEVPVSWMTAEEVFGINT